MNILTEEQAASRRLSLPAGGVLSGVSADFAAELQLNGTFVEYNEQAIVPAGEPLDYILCIVTGTATVSRISENYTRQRIGTLGPGQWFGEVSLFVRTPSTEELFAAGEVIVWSIAADTLRDLLFRKDESVQLLYNFGVLLAQKLLVGSDRSVAVSTPAA